MSPSSIEDVQQCIILAWPYCVLSHPPVLQGINGIHKDAIPRIGSAQVWRCMYSGFFRSEALALSLPYCSSWMPLHSRPGYGVMSALGPARWPVSICVHTTGGLLGHHTPCGGLGPCWCSLSVLGACVSVCDCGWAPTACQLLGRRTGTLVPSTCVSDVTSTQLGRHMVFCALLCKVLGTTMLRFVLLAQCNRSVAHSGKV